jgi:hypothetical protein
MSPHGTANRYSSGCRCRPCTDAAVVDRRERRQQQVESIGGPSSFPSPRRWALTEMAEAALRLPPTPVRASDYLAQIAEENRAALKALTEGAAA